MKRNEKTITEMDAARAEANRKRLETMRANLSKLENEARDIIEHGADNLTVCDRLRLLQLVKTAYHDSGKIEGVFSVDSTAACDFCSAMRKAAEDNCLIICGACYAAADEYKEAAWRRHKLNALIFGTVLFTVDELKTLHIDGGLCRFNEDGDTVNETMARNYLRITFGRLHTNFGYWYKNAVAVEAGLHAEGIYTREQLPKNVRFIHSSLLIGFPCALTWFDDARFTVFPDKETTEEAIKNGAYACNGRRCRACGYNCYLMERPEKPIDIAEYLRTCAANRAVILSAYYERRARIDGSI